MSKTKITINIEADGTYTKTEIEQFAEQLCHFIAGPDGEGIIVGKNVYSNTDRKFRVLLASFKRPEEVVWTMSLSKNGPF